MPPEQKPKQLGADRFKVLSWDHFDLTSKAMEPVWGRRYANQCAGGTIAHAPSIWRAMATGDPYRVRAFISDGNNTLMSYTNTKAIYEGLMSLDLLVVMDFFMTPTAQIADYVLPAATWLERPALDAGDDSTCFYYSGEKAVEPPPDCWTDYRFYRELAARMGQRQHWPWDDLEALYDYRLEPLGVTFQEFVTQYLVHGPELRVQEVREDRIRHAVAQGRTLLEHPRTTRLRPAPRLPGAAGKPREHSGVVRVTTRSSTSWGSGTTPHTSLLGARLTPFAGSSPSRACASTPRPPAGTGSNRVTGCTSRPRPAGSSFAPSSTMRRTPTSSASPTAGGSLSRPRACRDCRVSGSRTRRSSWRTATITVTRRRGCRSFVACCAACRGAERTRRGSTAVRDETLEARSTLVAGVRGSAWRAGGSVSPGR